MADGLLNKYFGINNVMTPRQWEGLGGLSAGLLAAGAPRVGAPGPNAWGAGFTQMGQSVKDYDITQRSLEMQELKKKMVEAQLAEQKRKEAEALRREQIMNEAFGMGAGAAPQSAAQRASMGATAPGPTVAAAQRREAMDPRERLGWELAAPQMAAGMFKEPKAAPNAQRLAEFLYPNDLEKQKEYVEKVTTMNKAPVVNLGSDPTMGAVPPGHRLIPDSSSPSGFRAVPFAGTETQIERDRLAKQNQDNYMVFSKSLQDLGDAIGATTTGPGLGWLPAVTSGQQLVERSKAILGPQLKDLFRKAGEGVFTNADQLVLEGLIPDRNTRPDVAKKNIEMIDYLVRVKLGIPIDSESGVFVPPPEGFTVVK